VRLRRESPGQRNELRDEYDVKGAEQMTHAASDVLEIRAVQTVPNAVRPSPLLLKMRCTVLRLMLTLD
jgi:hypothetical protein